MPFLRRPPTGLPLRFAAGLTAVLLAACGASDPAARPDAADGAATGAAPDLADDALPRSERIGAALAVLAADDMEGRRATTAGEIRARDWLVSEFERLGVEPAGESGYLQPVPLVRTTDDRGRTLFGLPPAGAGVEHLADEDRATAWNVLGIIRGVDPTIAHEVIVVGAHYDHVGIGQAVDGDSIYNGADDDASGTVAALEIARELVKERPGRSVLVALFSAEEMGLLGPRWFLRHPTVPLDSIVADLQIEMIGRPDSLAGGHGRGWLTGYERSTMGDRLAAAGSPIVPDPRPEMRFFFRSDNLPFAQAGIPAHTLSSYDLHTDYHRPSDEVDLVDLEHMAALTEAAVDMVRGLARGPRPEWNEGGRPEAPSRATGSSGG